VAYLQHPSAVFSYQTSLYLLGFAEREPIILEITSKRGGNTKTFAKDKIKPHFVKESQLGLGLAKAKTPFGNEVPCYSIERTLVDLLKSRNKIDFEVLIKAIKEYVRRPGAKAPVLLEYAKAFRVDKLMTTYLEAFFE
jgi:hypothetical protein